MELWKYCDELNWIAKRLFDRVNWITIPTITIHNDTTNAFKRNILMNNGSNFFLVVLATCVSCYGFLSLDGHIIVVSLTFSTNLVITFSFLLASLEGSDATGDGAVVPSATPISWKTGIWLNGEFSSFWASSALFCTHFLIRSAHASTVHRGVCQLTPCLSSPHCQQCHPDLQLEELAQLFSPKTSQRSPKMGGVYYPPCFLIFVVLLYHWSCDLSFHVLPLK